VFTKLCRLLAPLAQLVQSISFTPIGSEVQILQGAQKEQVPVSHKGGSETGLSAGSTKGMIRVGKLRSGWMN
jgi:hypothetical protein